MALFAVVLLNAQLASTQTAPPLSFFKNYIVTGDYVVGGVGLRGKGDATGFATGTISIPDQNQPNLKNVSVPPGANIVAAFLYWQTVEKSQSAFAGQRGFFNGFPIIGTLLGNPKAPVSWSAGGCAGSSQGTTTLRTYRADARPYVSLLGNVNTSYTVRLADSGSNGGGAPLTLGATLVIIYRVMSPAVPLNAITMYDGGFAPSNSGQTMSQPLGGYYQSASQTGKLTHIVGNGQANKTEQVFLGALANGTVSTNFSLPTLYPSLPPFPGIYNSSWDNPTWTPADYQGKPLTLPLANTSVTPSSTNSGCVSWGAVILSTPVPDSDNDGLLDPWEAAGGYTDFGTQQVVPLPGADPNTKDIYSQIDYMTAAGHTHLPKPAALDAVVTAFQNAPVDCDVNGHCKGIHLHFDVGTNYTCTVNNFACSISGSGGNALKESTYTCTDVPANNFYCQFPNQSGLTGWKSGVTLFKNQLFPLAKKDSYHYIFFGHNLAIPGESPNIWQIQDGSLASIVVSSTGSATVTTGAQNPLTAAIVTGARVTISDSLAAFSLNATYVVQSVLSANSFTIATKNVAAGTYGPAANIPDPYLAVTYLAPGPNGIPIRSISGWSDLGGADTMVTLGSWPSDFSTDNQTGSIQVQAGTLMHELGHTLGLTHGGTYFDTPGVPTYDQNCKPNYQSIMNYTFQIRGLTAGAVDYSRETLAPVGGVSLNEGSLSESAVLAVNGSAALLPYYGTTKWYAPLGFLQTIVQKTSDGLSFSSAATMHCDGTPITPQEKTPMFKIEGVIPAYGTGAFIDWNNDGQLTASLPALDVNFNGTAGGPAFRGYNDWANIDLRQIGARRNVLTFSGGVLGTDLASGGGSELISGGGTELSSGGGTDLSSGGGNDLSSGGGTDLSSGGGTDLSSGGGTDLSSGGGTEVNYDLANSTVDPPDHVKATQSGHTVVVTWNPPNFGQIRTYYIWRTNTTTTGISLANPPVNIGKFTVTTPPTSATFTFTFTDSKVQNKTTYTYFVTSVTSDQRSSGPSQFSIVNVVF